MRPRPAGEPTSPRPSAHVPTASPSGPARTGVCGVGEVHLNTQTLGFQPRPAKPKSLQVGLRRDECLGQACMRLTHPEF